MPTDIKGVPNLRQRVYWISFTYVGFPEPNRTEPHLRQLCTWAEITTPRPRLFLKARSRFFESFLWDVPVHFFFLRYCTFQAKLGRVSKTTSQNRIASEVFGGRIFQWLYNVQGRRGSVIKLFSYVWPGEKFHTKSLKFDELESLLYVKLNPSNAWGCSLL